MVMTTVALNRLTGTYLYPVLMPCGDTPSCTIQHTDCQRHIGWYLRLLPSHPANWYITDYFSHQLVSATPKRSTRDIFYIVIRNTDCLDNSQKAGTARIGRGQSRIRNGCHIRDGGIDTIDIVDAANIQDTHSVVGK